MENIKQTYWPDWEENTVIGRRKLKQLKQKQEEEMLKQKNEITKKQ